MPRIGKTPKDNDKFEHKGVKVTLRQRGARWRADFYVPLPDGGKPMRHAKSYASKEAAKQASQIIINNAKDGMDVRTAHELTVSRLGRLWLSEYHEFMNSAASTKTNVGLAFRRLADVGLGDITLENLRRGDVLRARDAFLKQNLSPGTVKNYILALRGALRWAMHPDRDPAIISINVASEISIPGVNQRQKVEHFLSESDVAEVLNLLRALPETADPLLHEIVVHFLANTGARISECLKLDLRDIDRERMTLRLNASGRAKTHAGYRTITISAELLASIDRLAGRWRHLEWGPVFVKRDGKVIHGVTVRRYLHDIGQRLELPASLHPHLFRHFHASRMLAAGLGLHAVKERLGQKDIATPSNLYGHLDVEDHREVLDALAARIQSLRAPDLNAKAALEEAETLLDQSAAVDEVERLLKDEEEETDA